MTEQKITFNNKKIAYSSVGNGFPLVFIHGFCEDKSMWDEFIVPFIDEYQIITIDIGGFGASELPVAPTISAMSVQVNAVLEAENIQKCIFIGHSMGGYIAMEFAKLYGTKLAGLTMFHTHPFGDSAIKKQNRDKGILFLKKYGAIKYVTGLIPQLFSPAARVTHKMILERLVQQAKTYDKETIISGLIAMRDRSNAAKVLENIDCPIQFIIGKQDNAIDWSQSIKQTHLPNIASIHILNEVGHMGMFEVKTVTQNLVADFITFSIKKQFK